jgi:metal transporter CNNM
LGLLSLDITGLRVLIDSGSEAEAKYAKRILPIRRRGNWLLCTLLFTNVLVNSVLSVVSAALFEGDAAADGAESSSAVVGTLIATALITIFGEILPQSICNRHGLIVGYYLAPVVVICLWLTCIVTFPLSYVLDRVLGEEMGTIYSRKELRQMIDFHAESTLSDLTAGESKLLAGALEFSQRTVADILTPIEQVFMLHVDSKLDFATMSRCLEHGHSRVPIFDQLGGTARILGILVVKDLILLDPEDETPVRTLLPVYGRDAITVFPDLHLDQMMAEFISCGTHLAVVRDVTEPDAGGDPTYVNLGIITLEDCIEALLQTDIADETDPTEANTRRMRMIRELAYAHRYGEEKEHTLLSPQQIDAIATFLASTYPGIFGPAVVPGSRLKQLITLSEVVNSRDLGLELLAADDPAANDVFTRIPAQKGADVEADAAAAPAISAAAAAIAASVSGAAAGPIPGSSGAVLYARGVPSQHFSLILSGRVSVLFGHEEFKSEQGPFSCFGTAALKPPAEGTEPGVWAPDYTAKAVTHFQLLRISRQLYNRIRGNESTAVA